MRFELTRPCGTCPFRTDFAFVLRRARVEDILRALTEGNRTFTCHNTRDCPQHCAGALILLERARRPNGMLRVAVRLRLYDPSKLDMAAPVYGSPEEMLAAEHWD